MGHFVYPNATHNRFAHSLGVFAIMCRIVRLLKEKTTQLSEKDFESLRLAALLHDIGHYPYSHLMERVDRVRLTEEELDKKQVHTVSLSQKKYPDHEALGAFILENQADVCEILGGKEKARKIAAMFSRTSAANPQWSKLIHSSLDMDRLDYLLRDSRAAGVPYGQIDLNYLLNSIQVSPSGMLGVAAKALPAAEHFLLARLFMHRVVYFHKTTYGFEEACRQLLRRVRNSGKHGILKTGNDVERYCASEQLAGFNDAYVDDIIRKAANDSSEPVSQVLAQCITRRVPPRLLKEEAGLVRRDNGHHAQATLRDNCINKLVSLAKKHGLHLGQFLICTVPPIDFEKRSAMMTADEAKKLEPESQDELIKVFVPDQTEPKSLVDIPGSVVKELSQNRFLSQRIYLADVAPGAESRFNKIRAEMTSWSKHS